MDPQASTYAASQAGERYLSLLDAMRGVLFASLGEAFSVRQVERIRETATEIARIYLRGERPLIEETLRSAAQSALQTAQRDLGVQVHVGLNDGLEAFLEQSIDYLETEVRAQLSRDVEMVVRRYRECAIDAQLNASASGFATLPLTSTGAQDRTRFYFRDRAGRLFPSQKFIRTAWRHALVSLTADFYLLEAASRGARSVRIVHPDPNSKWADLEIGLSTLGPDPSFIDVRDEVFHPQSDATLKAEL